MSIPTKAGTGRHAIAFSYVNARLDFELSRTFHFDVVNDGSWKDTALQDALARRHRAVAVLQEGVPCEALGLARYAGTGDTHLHATHAVADRNADFVNFGALAFLHAGTYGQEYRALLRFDLASVPKGTQVVEAHLQLYLYGWGGGKTGRGTFEVYEVLKPWGAGRGTSLYSKGKVLDGEASWKAHEHPQTWAKGGCDAPGVDRGERPMSTAAVDRRAKGWVTLKLDPALLNAWLARPGKNFGVLVVCRGGRGDFRSSEYADPPFRPRLVMGMK